MFRTCNLEFLLARFATEYLISFNVSIRRNYRQYLFFDLETLKKAAVAIAKYLQEIHRLCGKICVVTLICLAISAELCEMLLC